MLSAGLLLYTRGASALAFCYLCGECLYAKDLMDWCIGQEGIQRSSVDCFYTKTIRAIRREGCAGEFEETRCYDNARLSRELLPWNPNSYPLLPRSVCHRTRLAIGDIPFKGPLLFFPCSYIYKGSPLALPSRTHRWRLARFSS